MSAGVPVGDAIRYAEALDKALLARLRAGGAVTDAELAAAGVGDAAHRSAILAWSSGAQPPALEGGAA